MKRLLVVLGLVSAAMFAAISSGYGDAASRLAGNHPLEAEQRTAIADMDASAQLTMEIHLKPRNEAQLDKFLEELQDRHSPNFHKFLLPGEFDRSYGPLSSDVNAIADWLRDEGFTVTSAASTVQFTGTVAQAEDTFAVHIMKLSASEFSNLEDPILPSRFVPLIGYIEGLDNLMAAAPVTRIGGKLKTIETAAGARKLTRKEALAGRSQGVSALAAAQPAVDIGGISYGDVDMRNTYDVPDNVTLGSGDCIAIVGTSDFLDDSLSVFTDQFGDLPAINVTRKLVGSSDPGRNGAESEADIDLEWSHVMAPGAPIKFFYGTNLVNNITQAVTDDACKVISISFEFCGSSPSFYTSTLDTQFKRAASQGQSVFVSSGDRGAAGSVASGGGCVAGSSGRKVSEMASDPFVTAVGGTEILSPDY